MRIRAIKASVQKSLLANTPTSKETHRCPYVGRAEKAWHNACSSGRLHRLGSGNSLGMVMLLPKQDVFHAQAGSTQIYNYTEYGHI